MTPPLDVPRKLRQLDDDVREIYGMLAAIATTQQHHSEVLQSHTETLQSHTETLQSHTETLASHTAMLEGHSDTLTSHGQRLGRIEDKVDTVLELLRGG